MKKSINTPNQKQRFIILSQGLFLSKSDENKKTMNSSMYLKLFTVFFIINLLLIYAGEKLSCQTTVVPKTTWMKDGIIDAGGSHEPYIFRIRRGGGGLRTDEWQRYQEEHSEANVQKMAGLGINVFHTHLYKGFGMVAEMQEMEMTKELAKLVHKYGMKLDTYVQWGTLVYETFYNEVPEAKDWVQVDQFGHPILRYGSSQPFRYTPCFNNEGYKTYFKKVLKYAVQDVKSDFIHFDNFGNSYEPESCHCPACTQKFRTYLHNKYDDKTLKDRLGFTDLDQVIPPNIDMWASSQSWEVITDPLMQEWLDFRCKSLGDALREMALYIKSLNPEAVVEINFNPGLSGINIALRALDPCEALPSTEVMWTEEGNVADLTNDGRLISEIRSFKCARQFNNIALTYVTANEVSLAEDLSFNQTLGYLGGFNFSPTTTRYLDFYKQQRKDFLQTKDLADVAILRSHASMAYNSFSTQLSTILFEQTLIQCKIPFDIIFDPNLKDLSKYRVLVLANQECLSDEQCKLIRAFVQNGGGLVSTDNTSLYNEWTRLRPEPGLADVFQMKAAEFTGSSQQEKRINYGKGKAVYIPEIVPSTQLPEKRSSFTSLYWKLPKNWEQLSNAVTWACGKELSVHVDAPLSVVMNVVQQPGSGKIVIHLVNFDIKNPVKNISVSMTRDLKAKIKNITLKSPDISKEMPLTFNEKERVTFIVPELKIYDMVVIE
jgi:hypothetical protein